MKKHPCVRTDWFSPHLFWEGLKRLRVVGLGVLIIALAISVSVPVVNWMNTQTFEPKDYTTDFYFTEEDYYSSNIGSSVSHMGSAYVYDYLGSSVVRYSNLNPALNYLIPLSSPLFVWVLFSFLFSRNESDFYHSLPYRRRCLFLSFACAVLVWILCITLLSALIAGVLWIANPYRVLLVKNLLLLTLSSLLSSCLVAAFALLAVSLCGNLVSALINFAVFAILPRWTLFLMGDLLESTVSSISVSTYLGGFFSDEWCLPLRLFFDNEPPKAAVLLYSLLALLLLGFLACLAFIKRGSESAGNAVTGRRLQILFRCLFTLPFALFFTHGILIQGANHTSGDEIYIWLVVILVAYFLYELITTKRPRNLIRAIPHLLTVIGICLVFSLSFFGIRAAILHETWRAEKIEQVTIRGGSAPLDLPKGYSGALISDCAFDDPALLELFEQFHETGKQYNRVIYVWEKNLKTPSGRMLIPFEITLKSGRTVTREIYLSQEQLGQLKKILEQNATYQSLKKQFPPLERLSYAGFSKDGGRYYSFNNKDLSEFYAVFEAEYANASPMVKEKLLLNETKHSYFDLELSGFTSEKRYFNEIYFITEELLPQSYTWLNDYAKERDSERDFNAMDLPVYAE